MASGSELLKTLLFLHILIVLTRTPVSHEFPDSIFLYINNDQLDFFLSPHWQHFWLQGFETKNNQNLGSERKYKVLNTWEYRQAER